MKSDRIKPLLNLLKDNPDDPFLIFALAQEWMKTGRIDEALECYNKLLKTNPEYTATYYHLGKLYETTGELDLAAKTFKAGLERTKANGEHHAYSELEAALNLLGTE